jgi:hypothetical protein
MPIKPRYVTEMDLMRARQIVRSLTPLNGLSGEDAEFVAKTVAQCFSMGREQGLHQAKAEFEELRVCCLTPKCPLHASPHEPHHNAAITEGL